MRLVAILNKKESKSWHYSDIKNYQKNLIILEASSYHEKDRKWFSNFSKIRLCSSLNLECNLSYVDLEYLQNIQNIHFIISQDFLLENSYNNGQKMMRNYDISVKINDNPN